MPDRKKPFNRFSLAQAYDFLHITQMKEWQISARPIEPSAFFLEDLKRLEVFDLKSSEGGREVLIDAILEEGLNRRTRLKIWKEVALKSKDVSGRVEYLCAEKMDILKRPFVCLIEAKKDDFEKGAAQCLVAMKVCQSLNNQTSQCIDVFGMVSNGFIWQFYQLTKQNEVFTTSLFSFTEQMATVFGILDIIFGACENNLPPQP